MPDSAERLREALSGRYTIDREIGRGGMATVYLARDTRHDRNVALKVLLPELGSVLGVERFLGEIRVTANLQHPHLLPLFDSGEAAGQLFYVMPFVQGESLRARLQRERQLPIDDALRIAGQIAGALDYAHRNGVIHRDLKPENILLHDGQAVVADFGIALAVSNAGGARVTQTGLSLGTPQYMSPEQAAGHRVLDGRTDVYALGAITYEMLVGDPPHDAGSVQAVIAKVLTDNPAAVRTRRDTVPLHVDGAIMKALAKLPADRFTSAGEYANALTQPRPDLIAAAAAAAPTRGVDWRRVALLSAGAIAVLALGVIGGRLTLAPVEQPPPSRLGFDVSEEAPNTGSIGGRLAMTPDGSAVVYVGSLPSGTAVYVRRLDVDTVMSVAGSAGAEDIVLSRDGRRVLFTSGGQARLVPIEGGVALPAPGVGSLWFAHWGSDGSVLSSNDRGEVHRVAATGGTSSVIFPVDSAGFGFYLTDVLPDGRTALGLHISPVTSTAAPLMALDIETKGLTEVLSTPVYEAHYGGGVLVWVRDDGSVHGALFDPERKALVGPAVSLGASVRCGAGICQIAVADNGTIAYMPRRPGELVLVARNGTVHRATAATWDYHAPRFSTDGRIAVDFTMNGERDVWIVDGEQMERATFSNDGHDAIWDPDGSAITYLTSRRRSSRGVADSAPLRMLRARPATPGRADSVRLPSAVAGRGDWLEVPRAMVATWLDTQPGTGYDIVVLRDSTVHPLVATRFQEGWPDLSPDGRWLAYTSTESGRSEVYVQPIEGGGPRVRVSLDGGSEPVWSPRNRELFYRGGAPGGGRESMISARIATTPNPRVVEREALFASGAFDNAAPHANYDVSPDGSTFVMVRRPSASRIVVIQNVRELVRRLSHSTSPRK